MSLSTDKLTPKEEYLWTSRQKEIKDLKDECMLIPKKF